MFCGIEFVSCNVMTSECVFLMCSCVSCVLLLMQFAMSCRTLRKLFGDVLFVCVIWLKVL